MKLPIKFTVGETQYTVLQPKTLTKRRVGVAYLDCAAIHIATHWERKVRAEYGVMGRHETFWHETTHAILHDMGHSLCRDEVFVTQFARRLAQVIETSEFENGTT